MPIRVAVDAVGGDFAPDVVVDGCVRAARTLDGTVEVQLVGPIPVVEPVLKQHETAGLPITLIDAPEVIGMAESPSAAVKSKPRSSIHVGLQAQRTGDSDAFVSAGNTGAVMAAAFFILGRLPGVSRPAIIGYFPTVEGFCILIDVGTNVDCKPEHLLQFGMMGSVYAERVLGRERPAIGLMNIGEEESKGNEQVKAARELLSTAPGINFVGNLEGRDVMRHAADVIVCDGFVGNIMLKLGESIATELPRMVANEMARQKMGPAEQATVGRALSGVRKQFNYEEYGGVPLLGVAGNVLIGHGGSSARAVEKMVRVAADGVRQDVPQSITTALASLETSA